MDEAKRWNEGRDEADLQKAGALQMAHKILLGGSQIGIHGDGLSLQHPAVSSSRVARWQREGRPAGH